MAHGEKMRVMRWVDNQPFVAAAGRAVLG